MARTVTLGQLRSDARLYANSRTTTPTSAHISDAEWNRLINLQLTEQHETFVQARGVGFPGTVSRATFSTVAGTSLYDLPATFMELLRCALVYGPNDREVVPSVSNYPDADRLEMLDWARHAPKGFRITGSQIEFFPTPNAVATCEIVYTPAFQDLVDDADTYDGINGWEKVVALGAAVEAMALENRPNAAVERMYQEQRQRILDLVDDRQAQDPLEIRNVENPHGALEKGWRRSRWLY